MKIQGFKKMVLFAGLFTSAFVSLSLAANAFTGGNGTAESPYQIANTADLAELSALSAGKSFEGVYFVQTADIALNTSDAFTLDEDGMLAPKSDKAPVKYEPKIHGDVILDTTFILTAATSETDVSELSAPLMIDPIGKNSAYPFMGSYDGAGYTIRGLLLLPEYGNSGLFSYIKDAELKNITVENSILKIEKNAGGIAAKSDGASVLENCSFAGSVTAAQTPRTLGAYGGGIIGSVGAQTTVRACKSRADIYVKTSPLILYIGGIAGSNAGVIRECVNETPVYAVSDTYLVSCGGVVGNNAANGQVLGCVNTAEVVGEAADHVTLLYTGGIAGSNSGKIERVLNLGEISAYGKDVDAPNYGGGIVGYNNNGTVRVASNGANAYGDYAFIGGIAGVNLGIDGGAVVDNCLNTAKISNDLGETGSLIGGNVAIGKTGKTVLSSSLNLDTASGSSVSPSVGNVYGATEIDGIITRGDSDSYTQGISDEDLLGTTGLDGLDDEAWVYPQNGFFPALAIVKNDGAIESVALSADYDAGKAAFALYNPYEAQTVTAVMAFYRDGRLIGTHVETLTADAGYTSHVFAAKEITDAEEIKLIVLNTPTDVAPVADAVTF